MADSKISALTAITAPVATDEFVVASGGATKKIVPANLAKLMPGYELNYVEVTADVTSTATSDAAATAVLTAGAVTFDGASAVMIHYSAPAITHNTTATIVANLYDGSTDLGRIQAITIPTGAYSLPFVGWWRITPSAGSHTYSIRAHTASGTVTMKAGAGGTATLRPAFIRITRA